MTREYLDHIVPGGRAVTLSRERSTVTFEPHYAILLCGHIERVRKTFPSSKDTNVIVGLISLHVEKNTAL